MDEPVERGAILAIPLRIHRRMHPTLLCSCSLYPAIFSRGAACSWGRMKLSIFSEGGATFSPTHAMVVIHISGLAVLGAPCARLVGSGLYVESVNESASRAVLAPIDAEQSQINNKPTSNYTQLVKRLYGNLDLIISTLTSRWAPQPVLAMESLKQLAPLEQQMPDVVYWTEMHHEHCSKHHQRVQGLSKSSDYCSRQIIV